MLPLYLRSFSWEDYCCLLLRGPDAACIKSDPSKGQELFHRPLEMVVLRVADRAKRRPEHSPELRAAQLQVCKFLRMRARPSSQSLHETDTELRRAAGFSICFRIVLPGRIEHLQFDAEPSLALFPCHTTSDAHVCTSPGHLDSLDSHVSQRIRGNL